MKLLRALRHRRPDFLVDGETLIDESATFRVDSNLYLPGWVWLTNRRLIFRRRWYPLIALVNRDFGFLSIPLSEIAGIQVAESRWAKNPQGAPLLRSTNVSLELKSSVDKPTLSFRRSRRLLQELEARIEPEIAAGEPMLSGRSTAGLVWGGYVVQLGTIVACLLLWGFPGFIAATGIWTVASALRWFGSDPPRIA